MSQRLYLIFFALDCWNVSLARLKVAKFYRHLTKHGEIHAFPIYQKSKVPREHFRIPLGLARCRKKYQLQHTLIHLLFVTMMIHVEKAIPMSHKIHGCRPPPQKHDREKKEFPKKGSFVRRLPIFVHNKLSFRIFIAN